MELQEIYDRVRTHLLAQGRKAETRSGHCKYRGPGGTKCAVGCLLPDEHYSPGLEGQGVEDDLVIDALENAGVLPSTGGIEQLALLRELQRVHDTKEPEDWLFNLDQVAGRFGLRTS